MDDYGCCRDQCIVEIARKTEICVWWGKWKTETWSVSVAIHDCKQTGDRFLQLAALFWSWPRTFGHRFLESWLITWFYFIFLLGGWCGGCCGGACGWCQCTLTMLCHVEFWPLKEFSDAVCEVSNGYYGSFCLLHHCDWFVVLWNCQGLSRELPALLAKPYN